MGVWINPAETEFDDIRTGEEGLALQIRDAEKAAERYEANPWAIPTELLQTGKAIPSIFAGETDTKGQPVIAEEVYQFVNNEPWRNPAQELLSALNTKKPPVSETVTLPLAPGISDVTATYPVIPDTSNAGPISVFIPEETPPRDPVLTENAVELTTPEESVASPIMAVDEYPARESERLTNLINIQIPNPAFPDPDRDSSSQVSPDSLYSAIFAASRPATTAAPAQAVQAGFDAGKLVPLLIIGAVFGLVLKGW